MLSHAFETIGLFALAALFGGMVFFPSVVAPNVFRVLDADSAGRFLRILFPAYYVFIVVTALIASAAYHAEPVIAGGLFLVAFSTLLVRQVLVPKINGWRDAELAGDTTAKAKFDAGHRTSVIINLIQLAFVAWALFTRV